MCFTFYNFALCISLKKWEQFSPCHTRAPLMWLWLPCHAVSSVYIPYVFKHCDLLVLKIIILWEAVCITLYSQNQNTTFKIRLWVFTHGLWRAGSSEHRAISSKLMKRRWKYPLKHQEGGEDAPLKDSKLGALKECRNWMVCSWFAIYNVPRIYKPSSKAPWRVCNAVVSRGNAAWTTSKSRAPNLLSFRGVPSPLS